MALLYITKIFPQRQQFSKYHPQNQKLQLRKQPQHNANQVDPAYSSPHPESSTSWCSSIDTPVKAPSEKSGHCDASQEQWIPRLTENTEEMPWQCPGNLLFKEAWWLAFENRTLPSVTFTTVGFPGVKALVCVCVCVHECAHAWDYLI